LAEAAPRVTWPPRLVGALFEGPRPFGGLAYLALDSLTVLLGANGAGKSTTLRLLESHLPMLASRPGQEVADLPTSSCSFFVEVSDEQLELIVQDALTTDSPGSPHDEKVPFAVGAAGAACEVDAGESFLERGLQQLSGGGKVLNVDPARVATAMRDSRIMRVRSTGASRREIDWCLPWQLASELGITDGETDGDGDWPIPVASLGSTTRTMLPTAVAVPRALDDVRLELRDAILDTLVHLRWAERDRWARDHGVAIEDDGTRRGTKAWLKAPEAEVAAVEPDARALCALASDLATTLAPSFISDSHRISISVEPIHQWERGGPTIRLDLERDGGVRFSMHAAADGHKVWLQLAVLEAVAVLRRYLSVLEGLLERPDKVREAATAKSRGAWKQYDAAIELLRTFGRPKPGDGPPLEQFISLRNVGHRLYLIDEPEQHLHPRLQRSAARWLVDAGTAGASQCLVVTHSPHYLRIPGRVSFAYLQQVVGDSAQPRSVIRLLTPDVLAATDEVAQEMGFDRGELLSAVSTILFVEGQADKKFLDAFCGARLHHAGIALVPIHGAVHAERKGVVDSEVVLSWTAARLAVLLDNLVEDEWRKLEEDPDFRLEQARKPAKTELKAMAEILLRADQVGRSIVPLGIPVDDIFDLLDEDLLRERFDDFPGHAAARRAHDEATARKKVNWKAFYRDAYGIDVEPELFGEIGAAMAARNSTSAMLEELISRVVALVEDP
jgi:hypothetical protein